MPAVPFGDRELHGLAAGDAFARLHDAASGRVKLQGECAVLGGRFDAFDGVADARARFGLRRGCVAQAIRRAGAPLEGARMDSPRLPANGLALPPATGGAKMQR